MFRLTLLLMFLATLSTISPLSIAEPIAKLTPKQVAPSDREADNDPCNGSSDLEEVQCLSKALNEQDKELNQVYKQALSALPEKDNSDNRKERKQLIKSQRAWLEYRDENCSLIGGQEGGSNLWVSHFASLCVQNETAARIKFLRSIANGRDIP